MRARHLLLPAVVAVALVATVATVAAVGGGAGGDDEPAAASSLPNHEGRFVVECRYSHARPDDPIVYPRQPGRSHLHEFFGATEASAFSTAEGLVEGDTTCDTRQDTASYWAPALIGPDDEVIHPTSSDAYYRAGPGVDPADVEPFPLGLAVIGGDQTATEPQDTSVVGWTCGPNPVRHETPPDCGSRSRLALRVTFPDCWDGERLNTYDRSGDPPGAHDGHAFPPEHGAHMARSTAEGCPESHPHAVPQLEFVVEYPFWGDPSGLRLASGDVVTAHADFYNAWDEDKLADEVRYCIQADVTCGTPSIGTDHQGPQPAAAPSPTS